MKYKVVYPGADEVKEFDGLLEAFQNVVGNGAQGSFMLQQGDQPWENGVTLFRQMAKMFEPA
ncbi:hypothetical protein D3C71_1159860 [compost metagenome]